MARHTITLIPGDGIGYEVSEAARRVIDATGVDIEWDVQNAGLDVVEEFGQPMPDHVLESIRKNKVAIKGPLTTPVGKGIRSVNVALRRELDLFALVRPASGTPACAAATRTSTSSSCARTPRTSTRASSSPRGRRRPTS